MSLVIGAQMERVDGIDVIRDRLGNSGNVRQAVTPILREGARVGTETARTLAPKGATDRLSENIADDAIVFRIRGDVATARFGVQPVRNPGRGSRLYPLYVHEGTGIFGRLHKFIVAKRAGAMVFPGGGKPWPTQFGRTGRVVKHSVRGQKPQPYMTLAYEAAQQYVRAHLDDLMNDLVG